MWENLVLDNVLGYYLLCLYHKQNGPGMDWSPNDGSDRCFTSNMRCTLDGLYPLALDLEAAMVDSFQAPFGGFFGRLKKKTTHEHTECRCGRWAEAVVRDLGLREAPSMHVFCHNTSSARNNLVEMPF